jgi:hypothetical protein
MVSVGGAPATLHKANGKFASFARYIQSNGDTLIFISGTIGKYGTESSRHIEIELSNIPGPGIYSFHGDPNFFQRPWCQYMIGDYFFSTISELYRTEHGTPPGTVTIEALSATDIRGSFTANCSNYEKGTNYIQITNGTFKGTFIK